MSFSQNVMLPSLLLFLLSSNCIVASLDADESVRYNEDPYSVYMTAWLGAMEMIAKDPQAKADMENRVKADAREFVMPIPTFECDVDLGISAQIPTSVHELRPGDIKVVLATGDSVTAGFGVGAENLFEVFRNNRGESWSVGGEKTLEKGVITVPNVLKKFNPALKGYATCMTSSRGRHAWGNLAIGGAVAKGMRSQSQDVIDMCREDDRIDFEKDWKLVTLFVGGNDLCRSCGNDDSNSTMWGKYMGEALDLLHTELPRAFVNVVPMFDVTPLSNFTDGIVCYFIHQFICRCAIDPKERPDVRGTQLAYYEELKTLVGSGKYDTRDDFTVVIQPTLVDLDPPLDPDTDGEYDKSFLSYDCFHPSRKAHQAFAYMLWNCMLHPVGQKPLFIDYDTEQYTYKCPTEAEPYLATAMNIPGGSRSGKTKSVKDRKREKLRRRFSPNSAQDKP